MIWYCRGAQELDHFAIFGKFGSPGSAGCCPHVDGQGHDVTLGLEVCQPVFCLLKMISDRIFAGQPLHSIFGGVFPPSLLPAASEGGRIPEDWSSLFVRTSRCCTRSRRVRGHVGSVVSGRVHVFFEYMGKVTLNFLLFLTPSGLRGDGNVRYLLSFSFCQAWAV